MPKPKGFQVDHYDIAVHGLCADCARETEIIFMSTATETIEDLVKTEYSTASSPTSRRSPRRPD